MDRAGAVVGRILSLPTMWWIIISGALHNFNMYALGHFLSSFLQRYHLLNVRDAGLFSGLVYGSFGAVGIFVAGWIGDKAYHRHVSGRLHVSWICLALAVPCLFFALSAPSEHVYQFAVWLLPACMMMYAYYSTVYASIQDIIEPQLRGMAMAIYFCAMYLLGGLLGPVGTGWLSDYFRKGVTAELEGGGTAYISSIQERVLTADAIGLHRAMYIIPILCTILVFILFAASLTVGRDRERLLKRSQSKT